MRKPGYIGVSSIVNPGFLEKEKIIARPRRDGKAPRDAKRVNINDRFLSTVKPQSQRVIFYDRELKGYRGEGAEFKMSFGKFRGKKPKVREQILTLMEDADGRLGFTTGPVKAGRFDALCRALHENEVSTQDDLAEILDVDKGLISRLIKGAREDGLMPPKGLTLTGAGVMAGGGLM